MEVNSDRGTTSSFDILNSTEEYILNNLETVYPVLLEYFSGSVEDDSVTCRTLRLAFGPCLTLFKSDDLEEKLFKYACRYAEKYYIRILRNNLDNSAVNDKYSLDICQDVLSQLNSAIEYVMAEVSTLQMEKVKSLLLSTSVILLESYQFCVTYEEGKTLEFNKLALSLLLKRAQALHCQLFQLLSKLEINDVGFEVCTLNDILTHTYKSGMILLSLDVKAMADIWKGYITFIEKYSELLKTYHEVSVPIECLTINLTNNLESCITVNFSNIQNLDKTIKIFCFILKVIIKLVQNFSGFLGGCYKFLIDLLITLNKVSDPHYKILNLLADNANKFRQLVIGIDPLLSHLINDENFVQECSAKSKTINLNPEKRFGFLLLTCQIITKLTLAEGKTRSKWFNADDNILNYLFQIVISCSFEFSLDLKFPGILVPGKAKKLTDCFEYLLTHISAFLLMSTSQEFILAENILIKYIVKPNPWCSLLATDICCLLARFADAELCYNQLMNLCRLLIQFEKWPSVPEKLFLESAVSRLFPIMSQKHRDLFIELYPPEKYAYLWEIFGLQYLSVRVFNVVKSSVCNLAISQTNKFLLEENFEETEFMKMESALYGLNTQCNNINENFENNLVKLWKIDCIRFVSNPLGRRYLKSVCAATGSTLRFMPAKNMFSVLQAIKALFSFLQPCCVLYCLDVVGRLDKAVIPQGNLQHNTFKLISSLFKQFLTNQNIFIQTRSTEVFLSFASVTYHTQIITECYNSDRALQTRITNFLQRTHQPAESDWKIINFLKRIEYVKYEHFCDIGTEEKLYENDPSEPPLKKISLDKSAIESVELENMISLLKTQALKINENSYSLTALQKKELSTVIDLLHKLV